MPGGDLQPPGDPRQAEGEGHRGLLGQGRRVGGARGLGRAVWAPHFGGVLARLRAGHHAGLQHGHGQ
eukprot:8714897-Alexandrium_andersonii.AAC.1